VSANNIRKRPLIATPREITQQLKICSPLVHSLPIGCRRASKTEIYFSQLAADAMVRSGLKAIKVPRRVGCAPEPGNEANDPATSRKIVREESVKASRRESRDFDIFSLPPSGGKPYNLREIVGST